MAKNDTFINTRKLNNLTDAYNELQVSYQDTLKRVATLEVKVNGLPHFEWAFWRKKREFQFAEFFFEEFPFFLLWTISLYIGYSHRTSFGGGIYTTIGVAALFYWVFKSDKYFKNYRILMKREEKEGI